MKEFRELGFEVRVAWQGGSGEDVVARASNVSVARGAFEVAKKVYGEKRKVVLRMAAHIIEEHKP